MKKIILALVLIVSFFSVDVALACKPGGNWPPTPKENIAQRDVVFVGTVTSVIQDRSVNGEYRISFAVNQAYKGTLGDTVIVRTQSSSAACGYDNGYDTFKKGSVWTIYATGNEVEGYSTSSISVNTEHASVALAVAAMTTAGIVVPPKDESPVMCTMQYAPVCGKKDTETKTYGNSCMLGADKAEFLYEGECTAETPSKDPVKPVSRAPEISITADTEVAVTTPAQVATPSFWQRIVLSIKSVFSFWK